jgi:hypothetical protein
LIEDDEGFGLLWLCGIGFFFRNYERGIEDDVEGIMD